MDRLHRADTLIDWNIKHDFIRNQWWVITNRGDLVFPLLYAIICLFNVDDFINDTNMLLFLDVTTSWRSANTHICLFFDIFCSMETIITDPESNYILKVPTHGTGRISKKPFSSPAMWNKLLTDEL